MRKVLRLMLIALCAIPLTAQAAWLEARTKHFRIYSEGKPETLRHFSTKIERFDALLRLRFVVGDEPTPQPLTIFMLRSNEAVAKIAGGSKYVAGFYSPRETGSIAVVHRESGNDKYDLGADTVLFHEYAHHFMMRHFPVAYPAWYIEGFAEFISTTDFTEEGNAKIGLPPYYRAYGLLGQATISVAKLTTSNSSDFPRDSVDSFYGRSWLLVHYLNYEPARQGQLNRYLLAINAGSTSLDAAKLAFGDLATLDRELNAYLKKSKISYSKMVKPTPAPDKVEITTLSPAAGALVPHRLTIMRNTEGEDLAPVIAALTKITVQYPKEADAFRLLAEAQLLNENYAAADLAADQALQLNPVLARAMLVKAYVATHTYEAAPVASEGLAKSMRSWIVKANRADTNDPLPLIANYRSYELQGLKPNKTALDGLARAYQMVPEAPDVRMRYATALANEGQYDAAIRLVESLAFDPHMGPGATDARATLDALKEAKAKFPNAANPEAARKPKI
jgi:hypothetical protein